jgi:hypothetical protein
LGKIVARNVHNAKQKKIRIELVLRMLAVNGTAAKSVVLVTHRRKKNMGTQNTREGGKLY